MEFFFSIKNSWRDRHAAQLGRPCAPVMTDRASYEGPIVFARALLPSILCTHLLVV